MLSFSQLLQNLGHCFYHNVYKKKRIGKKLARQLPLCYYTFYIQCCVFDPQKTSMLILSKICRCHNVRNILILQNITSDFEWQRVLSYFKFISYLC